MLQLSVSPPRSAAVYRRLTAVGESLRVDLLDADRPAPEPAERWLKASRLPLSAGDLVNGEAARISAAHGSEPAPRVAASRFLHHYLWSVSLLFSGPWYLTGEVPRIGPDALWIEPSTGRLALRPDESRPGSGADLRAAVADHVGPVLAALQPRLGRGRRALWGMAADDLVSGIWYLGRMLGEEERAVRVAAEVLPGDTPPFPGAADFRRLPAAGGPGPLTRTRLGCCLYYALGPPVEACLTCPRTDDAERVRRLER